MSKVTGPGIRELEEEIADCERKIASAETAIEEAPDSNRSRMLNVTLRNKRAELEGLRRMLAARTETEERRARGLTALRAEASVRQAEADPIRMRMAEDPSRKGELEIRLRAEQTELDRIRAEIPDIERGSAERGGDGVVKAMKGEAALKDSKIADLEEAVRKLRSDLALAGAGASPALPPTDAARIAADENVELRGRIAEMGKGIEALAEANRDLSARMSLLRSENAEKSERIAALEVQLESSRKTVAELSKNNESLRAYIGRRSQGGVRP